MMDDINGSKDKNPSKMFVLVFPRVGTGREQHYRHNKPSFAHHGAHDSTSDSADRSKHLNKSTVLAALA